MFMQKRRTLIRSEKDLAVARTRNISRVSAHEQEALSYTTVTLYVTTTSTTENSQIMSDLFN